METTWLHALGKDKGSRPRCVLLVDEPRGTVAAQLTDLGFGPEYAVSLDEIRPRVFVVPWSLLAAADGRLHRPVQRRALSRRCRKGRR